MTTFRGKHPNQDAPDPSPATANVPLDPYTGPKVFAGGQKLTSSAPGGELGGVGGVLGGSFLGGPGGAVLNTDPNIMGKVDKRREDYLR